MRKSSILILPVVMSIASAAWAEVGAADRSADHEALKKLLVTTREAINTEKFDTLKPFLAKDNLTVVTVDGQKLQSLDAFQDYWKKLFENKVTALDKIMVNPVPDGDTEFLSENVGICHGTSNDQYFFKDGSVRSMPERWTAVIVKEGPVWKVSRIIFSANILDNPVITAVKDSTQNLILIAAAAGLLLGAAGGWLLGRKKK
jgi:LPXTG-motif cell wall-anchored protein